MTIDRVSADGVARWTYTLEPAARIAETVAATDFVPRAMRGNVPAVTACILYGDEIGVNPMTALQGIHVIDGRPFMSAELMRALVLGAGHRIRVAESTGTRCVVLGWRREDRHSSDEAALRVEWTIEMARAAGLAGRGAWRSYPRALLLARASADLCRMAFPDVVRGLGHIPEAPAETDVADWADWAESTGPEPAAPAPAPTETVQWKPRETLGQDTARVVAETLKGELRAIADDEAIGAPAPTETVQWNPGGGWQGRPLTRREPVDDEAIGAPAPWEDPAPVPVPTLPPEPEPEPVPAEDPRARLVTDEQVTRIMAAYGDLPFGPDRTTRLALFSVIVGRHIDSTKELERMESYRLLGALRDLRTGVTIATDDGNGNWTIHAGTEPPDEE